MGSEKQELGARGEDLVVGYLVGRGWTVLARNWRCRMGEIDIVARDPGGTVVVCEVKSRRGTGYGLPLEAVTPRKVARLRRLAVAWAHAAGQRGVHLRCDAFGVLWYADGTASVDHAWGIEP